MIYIVLILTLSVLYLWMVVRIWRGSALLGVLALFFSPVMIFAFFKNWGDPDTDIKVPFILSAVLGAFLYFTAYQDLRNVVAESAAYYTPEEIEQLREVDPEFAAMIEAEQAKAAAWEESEESESVDSGEALESLLSTAPAAPVEPAEPAVDPEVQRRADRRVAQQVRAHRGPIELGPAYARLATPGHFGFVRGTELKAIARLHGRELSSDVLGWVVHERVLLADERAWFAVVRFEQAGHLQIDGRDDGAGLQQALRETAGADGVGFIEDAAFAPRWSAADAMAVWTRRSADGSAVEAVAALPLRHGVLSYTVRIPDPSERELALRTVRLLGRETSVYDGWRHVDAPVDSPAKGPGLAEWIVEFSSRESGPEAPSTGP